MPSADAVLVPLCIGLSLVAVVVTVLAFVRGRRGRAVQGLAFAVAPVALLLTGLLRLVWDAVVALVRWATGNVFDLGAWIGFALLALCIVLWVVGGVLARRSRRARKAAKAGPAVASGTQAQPGVGAGRAPARRSRQQSAQQSGQQPAPEDDDMAEIEALLKSRGIQ